MNRLPDTAVSSPALDREGGQGGRLDAASGVTCACGRTIKPSGDCQNPRCSENAFYDEHWDERGVAKRG